MVEDQSFRKVKRFIFSVSLFLLLTNLSFAKNFNLIKGDTNKDYSLYSSHSTWESKEDFINWTKSEAFRLAHKNAAQHRDLYLGPPDFEGFEVVF